MPATRSATLAVPPPLPARARTVGPTLTPVPVLSPEAAPAVAPTATSTGTSIPTPTPIANAIPLGAVAALPSAEEAEAILTAALRGEVEPDQAWRAAAERVLPALSAGERAALSSGPLSFDPALLRAAGGLRLRLEVAVALVPARADLHATVFPALLGEVDDFLLRVKAAGSDAPAGTAEALDPVRLALLDGGVAFAGALARVGPAPAQPAAPLAPAARPGARVLSNVTAAEAANRGGKGMWVALVLALVVAGGYHGWRFATRKPPEPIPTLAGAPAHTFVIRQGASVVLREQAGAAVDRGELERFTVQERSKGNVVRPLGGGAWAIEPAAGEGAKQP